LKETNPAPLARAVGWNEAQIQSLLDFHAWLIDQLVAAGAPE
jgi:hypothetical protein